jgi:Mn2+/Fe2+ NRAMP family transporter
MVIMMLIASNKKIMKRFKLGWAFRVMGWVATGVMAVAAIGMAITAVL